MILAELDYTIPTVGLSIALYALIDKVIVPLIAKSKNNVPRSDYVIQDIRRRLDLIEKDNKEARKNLAELTTQLSVTVALLRRFDNKKDMS
jgi:hypothetical protein